MKNGKTIEEAKGYIDYIEGEVWKVIPNYSRYLISNYGRIFGFERNAIKKVKKYNGHRYLITRLYDDSGKLSNSIAIHRLVAEAFCSNFDPEHKTEVHHINVNSLDNRADNLVWLTPKEHREVHRRLRALRKQADELAKIKIRAYERGIMRDEAR